MKPEKIMESDVLDIIFENRNKEYGAYELRRNYNTRIGKALGITAMVVVAFGLMQSFKVPVKKGKITDLIIEADVRIADVKPEEEKKPKEEHKTKTIDQPVQYKQFQYTAPLITENPPMPVATNDDLEHAMIGKSTSDGQDTGEELPTPPSNGNSLTGETKVVEAVPEVPITIAEVMPQYPGGRDALIKFMQKNLRQPDDFEEGQKMTVVAKFVVDAEGNIVDIDITKNGRKDLDAEVIRVIKKMPNWVPGMQNGRKVAVYFQVPVTFVAAE